MSEKMTEEKAAEWIRSLAARKMSDHDLVEEVGWILLRLREGV